MSAIVVLITGHLAQVPIARTTSKGTPMATGSLAVEVAEDKPAYLGLLAFGSEARPCCNATRGMR